MQSGILYPPHLLRFLLGPDLRYADMQWLSMLHIWWAGMTAYLLGRELGLWRVPALMAAAAFMFSDLFLIHFGNLNLIAVASWIPLVLLFLHRYLGTGEVRVALASGLALGVGSLAGHIQITLYGLMAVALWSGLWLLLHRDDLSNVWRRGVAGVVIVSVVGLGLLAPVLLPGLEIARYSERSAWHYGQTVAFSLSPAQLVGLLIPGFFGRGPALHWGLWPRVEVGYAGVLTVLLAPLGFLMYRERLTRLLMGLAVIALAFSLGIYSALHGWLTWLLPGLEQLRAPARFIFIFDLALALLAGFGLQALLRPWTTDERTTFVRYWRWLKALLLIALAVAVPVVYAVLLLTQMADPTLHLRASVSTIAVVDFVLLLVAGMALLLARSRSWIRFDLLAALALALLVIDLASLGAYEDLSEQDPTRNFFRREIVDFLRADPDLFRIDTRTDIESLWQPDTALVHGLYDTWGVVNPLTLAYYKAFLDATGSRSSDLYALLNVKYLLARSDAPLDRDVWEPAYAADPDLTVYRNRRFRPRVHLLGHARSVPDLSSAEAAIRAANFRPLQEVVVEQGRDQSGATGRAQVTAWDVNRVEVDTEGSKEATLVVAQVWYPGWEASVDGGDWQPVLRADGVWQAVQLPAGRHHVVLRFRPRSFYAGLVVAVLTVLAVVLAWFYVRPSRARMPIR
ncbi:MAG: hypothetical protein D6791_12130 [Chloroflexi bacterium]|nr:MAG: hypothetical protein D6791_12130 [Chloroflexota bacterium]